MITHLEPDILQCEVKWTLGSITTSKASGGDGIPVELFQILKDDAVKLLDLINVSANLENSAYSPEVKNLPAVQKMQDMWVRFLDREDSLEEDMATHCSILAWKIPWTEEPGGLWSMGLQRVGHD